MSDTLLTRIVVPVASEGDARSTVRGLSRYVEPPEALIVAVHVIEKAGGAPDKASVDQREREAAEIFDAVTDSLSGLDVGLETEVLYGRDVAETIIEAAHEKNATAIAFTPRGGSRWVKLLSGDVTTKLVGESDVPIVVLPDRSEGHRER